MQLQTHLVGPQIQLRCATNNRLGQINPSLSLTETLTGQITSDDIHVTKKVEHELAFRSGIQRLRLIDLLNLPRTHDDDPVRQLQRLFLIMGDEHTGEIQLIMQIPQPPTQILAYLRIQSTEGFVQQQYLWLHGEGPGKGDSLFLPTRQLSRITLGQMGQLHHLQ